MDSAMIMSLGIPVVLLVVEYYLGQSKKPEANSILALIGNVLRLIVGKK